MGRPGSSAEMPGALSAFPKLQAQELKQHPCWQPSCSSVWPVWGHHIYSTMRLGWNSWMSKDTSFPHPQLLPWFFAETVWTWHTVWHLHFWIMEEDFQLYMKIREFSSILEKKKNAAFFFSSHDYNMSKLKPTALQVKECRYGMAVACSWDSGGVRSFTVGPIQWC